MLVFKKLRRKLEKKWFIKTNPTPFPKVTTSKSFFPLYKNFAKPFWKLVSKELGRGKTFKGIFSKKIKKKYLKEKWGGGFPKTKKTGKG